MDRSAPPPVSCSLGVIGMLGAGASQSQRRRALPLSAGRSALSRNALLHHRVVPAGFPSTALPAAVPDLAFPLGSTCRFAESAKSASPRPAVDDISCSSGCCATYPPSCIDGCTGHRRRFQEFSAPQASLVASERGVSGCS